MAASRCIRSCVGWSFPKSSLLMNSGLFSRLCKSPSRGFREIVDDSGSVSSKMTADEVNRRIFEGEFICFPNDRKVGFTANQVG